MTFKYKDKEFSSIELFGELIQDYGTCPECSNDRIGGTPSVGSINYDGEHGKFERGCKCGWKIQMKFEKV